MSRQRRAGRSTFTLGRTLDAQPVVERCREHIFSFEVLQGTMDAAFLEINGKEQAQ